jgi:FtsH-binding integral membrane protein
MVFLFATALQVIMMSPTCNFIMSVAGAALFSVYLVFDIDMIMHGFSEEEYIVACICVYMDIVGLFLRILQILNELNRN